MIRLIFIAVFAALAYLLIRYRANAKVQQWIIYGLLGCFGVYISIVVISELIR
ncbi:MULTISPECIES: hypothetical protein [Vibrio]|uniref:hypothetical protein n=1 Tax=Vibrio TaxID=662 RepID=UPI0015B4121D|nr:MULTISPECIES: hypothetical protein [Vibrio]MBD1575644.1 hypothetical protein [Vibrio sp. S11_S32]